MSKKYTNFVKPCSSAQADDQGSAIKSKSTTLSGEEAKKIYLKEVKSSGIARNIDQDNDTPTKFPKVTCRTGKKLLIINKDLSDRDLFISVQNDDVDTLRQVLDSCPDKINKLDDYGWSLLMIACQANSIEVAKELLERGIDTSIRDKAGNSAQNLIIKNKNLKLADLLLSFKNRRKDNVINEVNNIDTSNEEDKNTNFFCEICNIHVSLTRNSHLSSTVHNINLSKGKKIPTNYVIPETNKGFQIMLKVGWDKETGLGPDGGGSKYPIKTVQKKDRRGLGHGKRPANTGETEKTIKLKNRKVTGRDYEDNRKMEVHFRRQFY